MVIHKLDEVFDKTHELTQYSPEIVASVMQHVFRSWVDFLATPTHAGIRLPNLGVIRSVPKAIEYYLRNVVITKLRKDRNNEQLKEHFRIFWKYRRLLQEDEKRRKYKKRFGKWHYKKQSTASSEIE